jgi:hypothetical protein
MVENDNRGLEAKGLVSKADNYRYEPSPLGDGTRWKELPPQEAIKISRDGRFTVFEETIASANAHQKMIDDLTYEGMNVNAIVKPEDFKEEIQGGPDARQHITATETFTQMTDKAPRVDVA